jgi:PAS domain S-box-containing protein
MGNGEETLRSVFAASPNAITIIDLSGKIIDCNQGALGITGSSSRQELIGKNFIATIANKDRQRVREDLKKTLIQGSSKSLEYTFLKKDGSQYPAEVSTIVVKGTSGSPLAFVVIADDISKRKKTEEALSESEKRYRSVVDNIGVGVAVISPNMEILSLNKMMKKWFPDIDVSKKPICYRCFNRPPRKNVCSYCPTIKTIETGRTHEAITETPRVSKITNYKIVASPIKDKNGKVVAAIEMVEDVTERQHVEKQFKRYSEHLEELVEERTRKLQESEEHFRSVVERAAEAVVTVDNRDAIVSWNLAAEAIFGYSANEAIGKSITLIIPKRTRKNHHKLMRGLFHAGKSSITGKTIEVMACRKDGSKLLIELSTSVWRTKQGIFITAIIRDKTEQKRMEERLSALDFYGGKLNAAKNRKQIYKLTLDALKRTLGFEIASFLVVKKNDIEVVSQSGYQKLTLTKLPLDGSRKGITVKSAVTRKPVLVPDVSKDKDYVEGIPGIRSELAVPIIIDDEVLGLLNIESRKLDAFAEKDVVLVQILASHAATAMNSLANREEIQKRNKQQASLMKSSAEMIHSTELRQRLRAILEAIKGLGWRRVVLSVRNQNLDIEKPEDIVTAGLTNKEQEFLWTNKQPGKVWQERFGREFSRFRMGEFYYLPWGDPWVRRKFGAGVVASHLKPEEMVDWNPDDLLYAPLRLADGRTVGVVSVDDPLDGRRPTKESLAPLELFLHQAAVAIENAKLLQQLKEYSEHLEEKVEERTQELRGVQRQLLKSERLAAIGELAGMVGHDLRNPLTGITGATYYLRTKYGSKIDNRGKEMLEIIEKDIVHSNKIINDLLEYSREIKLEVTETSPKQLLKEALSFVPVPKNIQLVNNLQGRPRISVDIERMRRVFINIIKNAFDAMPNGGRLTITTKKVTNSLAFTFSDTGVGMSKETMSKLWTPLFTTKARGMGFGLPICKRILEAHGGKISVESEIDRGTTFTVTVPIEQKPTEGGERIWMNEPESLLLTTTKA